MKAKFKKFLEDNEVYDVFIDNLKKERLLSFAEHLNEGHHERFFVDRGLDWDSSPEGYDFWERINDLWNDELLK